MDMVEELLRTAIPLLSDVEVVENGHGSSETYRIPTLDVV